MTATIAVPPVETNLTENQKNYSEGLTRARDATVRQLASTFKSELANGQNLSINNFTTEFFKKHVLAKQETIKNMEAPLQEFFTAVVEVSIVALEGPTKLFFDVSGKTREFTEAFALAPSIKWKQERDAYIQQLEEQEGKKPSDSA